MGKVVSHRLRAKQRKRVAEESAQLLYTEQEKEYRQAKLRASKTLGIKFLPSNAEIATELDLLAEEKEGMERQKRLVEMREKALQIMRILINFEPILVGSVWRGTAMRTSDIDIVAYSQYPQCVISALQENSHNIVEIKVQTVTKKGKKEESFHINVEMPQCVHAEIVVRNPEEAKRSTRCEIYGDIITGLTIQQLQRVLKINPQRRFLPE